MLDPDRTSLLIAWNRSMAAMHALFAFATLATADMGMRFPLYRPAYTVSRPDDRAQMDGAYSTWLRATSLEPDGHYLYVAWCAFAFSALSAGFHLGNAQLWRKWYLSNIADARCPARWVEYALSAPLQAVCIAYLTGTTTTDAIVSVFVLVSTTMVFGHLTEDAARPEGEEGWARPPAERLVPHLLGYVPFLAAVGVILQGFARASGVSAVVDGEERSMPAFVYAIVTSQLLLFTSFTFVQLAATLRAPKWYVQGEIAYMVLSLVAKGILSFLLLTNVIALQFFA